jgi:hypothetical protein
MMSIHNTMYNMNYPSLIYTIITIYIVNVHIIIFGFIILLFY